ncbi:response regulator [Vibrio gallicus]|uniref:response regulator n=1 Tax=Vibrio gallicus TaxID=190897 RepID=UPI0021C275DF|nr:response regulator [Vibrio gallicus]
MQKLLLLCVDDERDVLDSVIRDLEPFSPFCEIEAAESVAEARDVIDEYLSESTPLALILCDHIMPEESGIPFLIELNQNPDTRNSKKILVTGQADLEDTIQAVNNHCLDFYIAKPWQVELLQQTVKQHLTDYVIAHTNNPMQWVTYLDSRQILQAMAEKRTQFGE